MRAEKRKKEQTHRKKRLPLGESLLRTSPFPHGRSRNKVRKETALRAKCSTRPQTHGNNSHPKPGMDQPLPQ